MGRPRGSVVRHVIEAPGCSRARSRATLNVDSADSTEGGLDGDRHDPGTDSLKRSLLVVLGLSLITLGIYGLYWYFKVNEEIKRYTGDQTISPGRSFAAVFPGLLNVPPFIAYYNTSNHIVRMQQQRGLASQISPALVVVLGIGDLIGMASTSRST